MQCANLSEVIRGIRDSSGLRHRKKSIALPYLELYFKPKILTIQKPAAPDGKQQLMERIRYRFQSLSNPYKHDITLRKAEIDSFLPKLKQELTDSPHPPLKPRPTDRRLHSHNSTPKKKYLLFYRLNAPSSLTLHDHLKSSIFNVI